MHNSPIQDMLGPIRLFQTLFNADMDFFANHTHANDDMFERWDECNAYFDSITMKDGKKISRRPSLEECKQLLVFAENFQKSIQGFQQQGFEADENSNTGSELHMATKELVNLLKEGVKKITNGKGEEWEMILKARKTISAKLPETLVNFYNSFSKYFWSVNGQGFKNATLVQSSYPTFFAKLFDNCHAIGNDQAHYAALNSKTTEQKEIFNRWYDIISYDSDILISHLIRLAKMHPCYKKFKLDREKECELILKRPVKLDSKESVMAVINEIKSKPLLYGMGEEQSSLLKKWLTIEHIAFTNCKHLSNSAQQKIQPSFFDRAERIKEYQERLKAEMPLVDHEDDDELDVSFGPSI